MFFTTCICYLALALFGYVTGWRQCCPNFRQSRTGDLRADEDEVFQAGQSFQVHQPRIRDSRVVIKDERCEICEAIHVLQSSIRDLGIVEPENGETG